MSNFCERPFAQSLSFVFLIIFAPALALLAIAGMSYGGTTPENCVYGMTQTWALVMAFECFVDFAVAIYIFCKFNEPYDFNNPKDRSYTSRMQRLLCEDPCVAMYICVLIFKFIWTIMGSVWSAPPTRLEACPNGYGTMIEVMQIFSWIFFGIGGSLIMFHWFYITCCPQHANASAAKQMARQQERQNRRLNGGQQNGGRQPVQQTMNRQPMYQARAAQQQVPVATAQPIYHDNNQRGAVQQVPARGQFQQQQPQVVVHQPARTSQTGAAKQQEPSTAGKLFGRAKGLFGR